jgi:hypothetical protein
MRWFTLPKASDMTVEEEFNYTVATLVSLAEELDVGTVDGIRISIQASGELPYQLVVREEDVPIAGLARMDKKPSADGQTSGP